MKFLGGLALVVTGGAMVSGAYLAGFCSGMALMMWSEDRDQQADVDEAEEKVKDAAETVNEEAKPS